MKKRFLVAAVAATLVSPLAAVAAPTAYGVAHVSFDMNTGAADDMTVSSRASRLGFKGSEDLGGGTKLVYKMEFGVKMDDTGAFSGRNQYVGMSTGMGTVLLGRHDSPMKMVQGKFDQFNDTIADMGGMVNGETREQDAVTLISPDFGGMKVMLGLGQGETAGDSIADSTSIAFQYKAKALFVSLAANSASTGGATQVTEDQTRLVATYDMGDMAFGGIYSTSDFGSADDETSMGLSFGMKMSEKGKVKFQYIDTSDTGGVAGTDDTRMDLGYDHKMSKATTVYAMYDTFDVADADAISFGIVHKF